MANSSEKKKKNNMKKEKILLDIQAIWQENSYNVSI